MDRLRILIVSSQMLLYMWWPCTNGKLLLKLRVYHSEKFTPSEPKLLYGICFICLCYAAMLLSDKYYGNNQSILIGASPYIQSSYTYKQFTLQSAWPRHVTICLIFIYLYYSVLIAHQSKLS